MNSTQQLQKCVDMLAEKYVAALRGAKVICFVRHYEIWSHEYHSLAVGSYSYLLVYLGYVAITKQVLGFNDLMPIIYLCAFNSATVARVL